MGTTLNKKMVIDTVADRAGFTKKDTTLLLDTFFDLVLDVMKNRDKMQIVGFGTFETKTRAGREGRNPHTGETMTIGEIVTPKFKASTIMKEAVKNGK